MINEKSGLVIVLKNKLDKQRQINQRAIIREQKLLKEIKQLKQQIENKAGRN